MNGISLTDPWGLAAVALAMALGGILKGATGAGLPVITIPVLASLYDVRTAVAVMVLPSLVTNARQIWIFRAAPVDPAFVRMLSIAGAIGAGLGTLALAWLPPVYVQTAMVAIIAVYIALRIARSDIRLPMETAGRWVGPAGVAGGLLQGAVGLSAPVAITFLNAIRLERPTFILTVSAFFAAMCLVQLPIQAANGLMTAETALLGSLALVPLAISLPLGEWIGSKVSAQVFDRLLLVLLSVLALRLSFDLIH